MRTYEVEICWESEIVECRRIRVRACSYADAAIKAQRRVARTAKKHGPGALEVVDVQCLPGTAQALSGGGL